MMGLTTTNQLMVWGQSRSGMLGTYEHEGFSPFPIPVPISFKTLNHVALGPTTSIIIADDEMYGLGSNNYELLGIPTLEVIYERAVMEYIPPIFRFSVVSFAFTSPYLYIISSTDRLFLVSFESTELPQVLFERAKSVVANDELVSVLTIDRRLYNKQKHNTQFSQETSMLNETILEMCAQGATTLLLTSSAHVYEQIGNKPYRLVSPTTSAIFVACAARRSFLVSSDSRLYTWNPNGPISWIIDIGFAIKQLSGGNNHLLILSTAGAVYVHGNNTLGQLGISDTSFVTTITRIPLPCTVSKISASHDISMLLCTNGDVYMTGALSPTVYRVGFEKVNTEAKARGIYASRYAGFFMDANSTLFRAGNSHNEVDRMTMKNAAPIDAVYPVKSYLCSKYPFPCSSIIDIKVSMTFGMILLKGEHILVFLFSK